MSSWWEVAIFVVLLVLLASAAWAGISAAPYLPTRARDLQRLVQLAGFRDGQRVYDLGAGDGRLLLAATAAARVRAVGYEISFMPWLVARWRLRGRAKIFLRDFFRADLSDADVLVCFLTPRPMARLAVKLRQELRPGTIVLSYAFPIPDLGPGQQDKPTADQISIYKYVIPD